MKKSLLALAVLGAFAGAAAAQSSVTIGGFIDEGVGKAIGSKDKTVLDAGGSRLYFKGMEDLGGGTAGIFNIETRIDPARGNAYNQTSTGAPGTGGATFWNGRSTVGLVSSLGTVELGRDYAVSFPMIQNQIDPFGGDTVADLRDVGMRPANAAAGTIPAVSPFRFNSQVQYHFGANGFNFGANVGGSNENGVAKKPYSVAANYAAGPLFLGAGIEDPGNVNDKIWNLGGRYNLGFATLSAGMARGKDKLDNKIKGLLVGAVVPVGGGDLKLGYAKENTNPTNNFLGKSRFGLGYHYYLSKRTKVYADVAHESKYTGGGVDKQQFKTGYDLGVRVGF